MDSSGQLYTLSELKEKDLEVEDTEPKHARVPSSFVLSANGERYRNTKVQRKKARKAQRVARRRTR